MSDFSIPGVTASKYGTDKLIEGLMKVERVPRDSAQARLATLEKQQSVWLDLNRNMTSLRDSSRGLYSFRNPFSDRIAKSSNEDALTATATREALEQTRKIGVERVATADRFISSSLAKDYRVAQGDYVFSLGDKKVELRFAGGKLQDFADALARKGRDLIGASVMGVTADTKSLVIEGLKTGSKNRLGFSGDAEKLALDLGLVERANTRASILDASHPASWTLPIDPKAVSFQSGALGIETGGEARLSLPATVQTKGLKLEIKYRLTRLPEAPTPLPPPGPSLPDPGSISYEGISVRGAQTASGLPDWFPPPTPPRVDDPQMLFALGPAASAGASGAAPLPLPPLADSTDTATITLDLEGLLPEISALGIRNRDTGRRLELVSARIFDPAETGGLRPKKPISSAGDALVSVDGVEGSRESNEIKDMVPGVTLQLKEAADKPVKLSIEPDRKSAKEAIIALVGNYNKLMAWVNILTRADPAVIAQLDYFTDAEKKTAGERLGIYQGDSTLSVLKNNLQRAMMEPYATRMGRDLSLLSQIGVSTDARKGGGQGLDTSRLLGYIEIDEESLDKALAANFSAVRDLFGNDTTGDLVVDSGVAYTLDMGLKPYVETGGILALKSQTITTQIGTQKRTLATLDEALAAKESDLKRKYGMMEGALNSMQSSGNSIDNSIRNSGG